MAQEKTGSLEPVVILLDRVEQFLQAPRMAGDTSRHRRRLPQGSVEPAKVVVREVQRSRRDEVRQLLGEAKRQASEPAKESTDREVVPLGRRLSRSMQWHETRARNVQDIAKDIALRNLDVLTLHRS